MTRPPRRAAKPPRTRPIRALARWRRGPVAARCRKPTATPRARPARAAGAVRAATAATRHPAAGTSPPRSPVSRTKWLAIAPPAVGAPGPVEGCRVKRPSSATLTSDAGSRTAPPIRRGHWQRTVGGTDRLFPKAATVARALLPGSRDRLPRTCFWFASTAPGSGCASRRGDARRATPQRGRWRENTIGHEVAGAARRPAPAAGVRSASGCSWRARAAPVRRCSTICARSSATVRLVRPRVPGSW